MWFDGLTPSERKLSDRFERIINNNSISWAFQDDGDARYITGYLPEIGVVEFHDESVGPRTAKLYGIFTNVSKRIYDIIKKQYDVQSAKDKIAERESRVATIFEILD